MTEEFKMCVVFSLKFVRTIRATIIIVAIDNMNSEFQVEQLTDISHTGPQETVNVLERVRK